MIKDECFKAGMRRLAGGVTIISVAGEDGPRGLTATAVTSLSADPPSLVACVNRRLEAASAIERAGGFCVSVLSHEQERIARRFAGMEGVTGRARFISGDWRRGGRGAPMLNGALVNFECSLLSFVAAGTHQIFIGEVMAVHLGNRGRPLLYCDGNFSTLAA